MKILINIITIAFIHDAGVKNCQVIITAPQNKEILWVMLGLDGC